MWMYSQVIEILGWYPARSVFPHGEKLSLNSWFIIPLVMVSPKNTLWVKFFITMIIFKTHISILKTHISLLISLKLNLN